MSKRLISVLLIFVMLINNTVTGNADTGMNLNRNVLVSEISEIEDGFMYLYGTNEKAVVILVNVPMKYVSAAITYNNGKTYEFSINEFQNIKFDPQSYAFYESIIRYMESNLEAGKVVEIIITEENVDLLKTRSSVGADLKAEMTSRHGSEYSERLLTTTSYGGYSMKIKESMKFNISEVKSFSWSSALSVASFISKYIGSNATSLTVKAVCGIFGVALSAASTIPSGSAKKYLCRALVSRWTYVGSVTVPCNTTQKYIDYYGMDDNNPNSTNPAKIYSEATYSYSHSSSYFTSYSQQAEDAYEYYLAYY